MTSLWFNKAQSRAPAATRAAGVAAIRACAVAVGFVALAMPQPAAAQGNAASQATAPNGQTQTSPSPSRPSPTQPAAGAPVRTTALTAHAIFAGDNKPIRSGLNWRVLKDDGEGAVPAIVARSSEAAARFELPPGSYVLHATYGYASGWKRITVGQAPLNERLVLSAGALRLAAAIGDRPIPPALVSFSVFVPLAGNAEGRLVAENLRVGDTLRLPEGTYHVVSTYGDANAIRRADITVESGRLVEATIMHRAAKATLKLVAQPGGEAFAGTAFTVLTPGGDVIREAIGAFPEVILAEGDYILIARQETKVHTRDFRIDAGVDRDIEVVVGR